MMRVGEIYIAQPPTGNRRVHLGVLCPFGAPIRQSASIISDTGEGGYFYKVRYLEGHAYQGYTYRRAPFSEVVAQTPIGSPMF